MHPPDTAPRRSSGNDVLAAGALSRARKMGLRGRGRTSPSRAARQDIAEIVTPALTTVHVPHRAMGRGAARMLVAMRNGEDPGPSVELEATIAERESLGPAPVTPGL
ncbi:MAG: substrate-binding domain-containing protein [Paracoccaceae bacterium]